MGFKEIDTCFGRKGRTRLVNTKNIRNITEVNVLYRCFAVKVASYRLQVTGSTNSRLRTNCQASGNRKPVTYEPVTCNISFRYGPKKKKAPFGSLLDQTVL
jgi:hypothetical protein